LDFLHAAYGEFGGATAGRRLAAIISPARARPRAGLAGARARAVATLHRL